MMDNRGICMSTYFFQYYYDDYDYDLWRVVDMVSTVTISIITQTRGCTRMSAEDSFAAFLQSGIKSNQIKSNLIKSDQIRSDQESPSCPIS